MKKILYLLAVMSFGLLAPATADAAPAAPAAPAAAALTIPVDKTLSPAEQKAVRGYIISSMRASALAMKAQAETSNPTLRQILQTSLTANNSISLEGLPARYQAFITESRLLGQQILSQFRGLDKTIEQLTPEDNLQMQASAADALVQTQALEAKYPDVAQYLGTQALTQLSNDLSAKSGIRQKVLARVMEQAADFDGDQAKLSQLALKLSCELLLEEIDKLSAE